MAIMANIDVEGVLKGKYPAKAHIANVVKYIEKKQGAQNASGVLYLEGREDKQLEDSDEPVPFRQRRAFMYLSGVDRPDCALVYDTKTHKSTLFIPGIKPDDVIWSGLPLSPDEAKEQYDVDEVLPVQNLDEALEHVKGLAKQHSKIFTIAGRVSQSDKAQAALSSFEVQDTAILGEACDECRVLKDEYELALIRKANIVSGIAHRAVLERVRDATNEYELEGVFIGTCTSHGAKKQAYPSIVAGGRAAATLHYVPNDKALPAGKDLLLLDAGAEWDCYAADITRTFPISGKFTPESRAIYDIVLRMQNECTAMLKENVSWDEVHLHAHKVAIEGLHGLGVLKGDKAAILEARTSAAFFPHGLGHYLGMDTHDTGGHPNFSDPDPVFRYLRVRQNLPAGSVITVEPGVSESLLRNVWL